MTTRTSRCVVCGTAVVPASGRVCPLHLQASEQQILAEQASRPLAWVLAAGHDAAVRPPTASVWEAEMPAGAVVLASFSERFFALAIDLAFAGMTGLVLAAFVSASTGAAPVAGLAGWVGYFLLSNSLGQLVGKAMLGIKVIDPATGREPGFGKGALRTVGMTLNLFFTFGFGFLMMIGDSRNMTIHDHLAGTLVIRKTGAAG